MSFKKHIYILTLLIAVCGCGNEEVGPFTTGSRFSYATYYTSPDGRITRYDTLSFTIEEKDITNYKKGIRKIKWENTRHDYYQFRDIDVEDDRIELQLPLNYRGFDHIQIAIAGHPTVLMNMEQGRTTKEMKLYKQAYGSLNGKTIEQSTKYLRDTTIDFDGTTLPCKLYQKYNSQVDTLGRYSIMYTYSPQYGFVTMNYYYPNNKHISLLLIDVVINRP